MVPHKRLLLKLEAMGIKGDKLNWIAVVKWWETKS